MRIVLQRVSRAGVRVGTRTIGEIGRGYVALVGIARDDGPAVADAAAEKVARIRLFPDPDRPGTRPIDVSLTDAGGSVLAVSQFTLLADTRKGRRPSFADAAPGAEARAVFDRFVAGLRHRGVCTETGEFGAHMQVELVNDGPVTIVLDL